MLHLLLFSENIVWQHKYKIKLITIIVVCM